MLEFPANLLIFYNDKAMNISSRLLHKKKQTTKDILRVFLKDSNETGMNLLGM
jgi:hypothetical protein